MRMRNKVLAWLSASLIVAEVVLALLSWLFAAVNPDSGVRNMLSGEGIRWAFGGYINQMQSSVLVWLLLGGMAYGALHFSRFTAGARSMRYRQRVALRFSIAILLLYLAVVAFFAFAPHAILLSVTGDLFPSAFSDAIVPVACFGVVLMSIVYGVMSGSFPSVSSVFDALVGGICRVAPFLVVYLLATHVYYIAYYIF